MPPFTIFPAIDLRRGEVVRLSQGDPERQKTYSSNPVSVADGMIKEGTSWLHVINLDGAFGDSSDLNLKALQSILQIAHQKGVCVQSGGGLHSVDQVRSILSLGVDRAILGSMAAKEPENVRMLLKNFSADQIAVSLDGRKQKVMIAGWQEESDVTVFDLAVKLKSMGLEWLVYTDIDRDGMQSGSDFKTTITLAEKTGLKVIASGGVSTFQEVKELKQRGAAGAILGRALYEGTLSLSDILALEEKG